MSVKIKLQDIEVYGVDTHARANSIRKMVLGEGRIRPPRIPILRGVSFEANPGDRVGILGMNGSGKSSLLKVISGNYPIHGGIREVFGVMVPLIEMGTGFDQEMTGRRNIKLTYAVRGKLCDWSKEMEARIIEFSELGEKIELPLKTYSTGMRARLAFSSAIFQDPDILLLDEVFATGDAGFVDKSRRMMMQKVDEASITILVGHGKQDVMKLCNRAIVMHQGLIVAEGGMAEMHDYYTREILHLVPGEAKGAALASPVAAPASGARH
jgi:lipopolysaccharide transport system ATP-binding protein